MDNRPLKLAHSVAELEEMSLDEAMERSHAIVDTAIEQIHEDGKQLTKIVCLFSGGNDSTTLLHLMRSRIHYAAHINTGIGIEETRTYVRETTEAFGLPLLEEHPPDSYDDLVLGRVHAQKGKHAGEAVWRGFPGPGSHPFIYARLKERALRQLRRRFITHPRRQRIIFLAGMRAMESARRFRNAGEIDREGSVVWVSPIVGWTDRHMNQYRRRYNLPRNQVADVLHMSGECLCGCFAKPGELDLIAAFYPETAQRIRDLEQQAKAAGISACTWGKRPPATGAPPAGRLCSSCVVTDEQHLDDITKMINDPTYTRTTA
jgi:3'-phosphoadenosine 5'-phosphosulfate sulfotransferase (PAPS reductase)/FAD synthetase